MRRKELVRYLDDEIEWLGNLSDFLGFLALSGIGSLLMLAGALIIGGMG